MNGTELKTIRERLGLSQEKMASYLGLCSSGYYKQESGRVPVSRRTVLELHARRHIELDNNYAPMRIIR
jgi:transcriptional regulator with XRE-family HTH domain